MLKMKRMRVSMMLEKKIPTMQLVHHEDEIIIDGYVIQFTDRGCVLVASNDIRSTPYEVSFAKDVGDMIYSINDYITPLYYDFVDAREKLDFACYRHILLVVTEGLMKLADVTKGGFVIKTLDGLNKVEPSTNTHKLVWDDPAINNMRDKFRHAFIDITSPPLTRLLEVELVGFADKRRIFITINRSPLWTVGVRIITQPDTTNSVVHDTERTINLFGLSDFFTTNIIFEVLTKMIKEEM